MKLSRMITASFAFASMLGGPVQAQHDVHAALIARTSRKPAPVFHLVSDKGRIAQVSDYRGTVVLLNFWATECGGCKLEIPWFVDIQKTYHAKGFTAIGIAMDVPYESLKNADEAWAKVRPFEVSRGVNYPILMGDDAVVTSYGFNAYPATYLIDQSGKIAATYEGVVSKEDVAANIDRLLGER